MMTNCGTLLKFNCELPNLFPISHQPKVKLQTVKIMIVYDLGILDDGY